MLASGGENKVRFRFRGHGFPRMVEQDTAQAFGEQRPSWFSSVQHVQTLRGQPLAQSSSLCRFSASFTAFQRDEDARRFFGCSTH